MLSVGKIVGGGFSLIKDHPVAVLVWGLCYAVASVGIMLAMRPFMAAQAAMMGGEDPAVHLQHGLDDDRAGQDEEAIPRALRQQDLVVGIAVRLDQALSGREGVVALVVSPAGRASA